MTPSRPYFVRAIYEWLNDNGLTPYLLVDATRPGVQVPTPFVKDGRIVLNIAPGAVRDLFLHNTEVSFSARFGGVPMQVFVPMAAVLAIYSRENGQGMFFDEEDYPEEVVAATPAAPALATVRTLEAVRVPDAGGSADEAGDASAAPAGEGAGGARPADSAPASPDGGEPEPPRPGGGRPSLRVVK